MSGRQRNYVSLSSNDEIDGNVTFLAAYEDATPLERLDLLSDWIGLLQLQYEAQLLEWRCQLIKQGAKRHE